MTHVYTPNVVLSIIGGRWEWSWTPSDSPKRASPADHRPHTAAVDAEGRAAGRWDARARQNDPGGHPRYFERMRTTADRNVDRDRKETLAVLLIAALFALMRGVPWTLRWARSLGNRSPWWRHGHAVLCTAGGGPFDVVTLDVRYDDGDSEQLYLTRPVRGVLTASQRRITGTTEVWITEQGPPDGITGTGSRSACDRPATTGCPPALVRRADSPHRSTRWNAATSRVRDRRGLRTDRTVLFGATLVVPAARWA
ncbi:hypothetical protein GCM10010492_60240 [Saccharothrix mutabilis subsp. mutabilis]|uniref:Uncharacterized protein n=2 Tax=Saccharothrix mutabilis TaxID=33921 RepID=A0ABN0UIH7_9PSEU